MNRETLAIIVTHNPSTESFDDNVRRLGLQCCVAIIDNASTNRLDVEGIASKYGSIYVPLSDNLGLAEAQNVGIRLAFDLGKEYICLFDQDSQVEDGFIDSLYSFFIEMSAKHNVGAVGPLAFDSRVGKPYPVSIYQGLRLKNLDVSPNSTDVQPAFLIASGSFIPLSVIEIVGEMRADFFIDYVDIEWSFRAKKKGYDLFICPDVRLNHEIGDSRVSVFGRRVSLHSPFRRFFLTRNALWMMRLPHVDLRYKVREFILIFVRFLVLLLYSNDRRNTVSCFLAGIWQGLLGYEDGKR